MRAFASGAAPACAMLFEMLIACMPLFVAACDTSNMHLHPQGQAQEARGCRCQARCVPPLPISADSCGDVRAFAHMHALAAGRDDGEDGAAPSKKHAEDGKPVEEYDPDADQVSVHVCLWHARQCACELRCMLKLDRRVSRTRFCLCRTCRSLPPLLQSPLR